MIDGSRLSLEDNIKLTKMVVDYAHPRGVNVEGEVGALSGFEDLDEKKEGRQVENIFTNPEDAAKFIEYTGVDCLLGRFTDWINPLPEIWYFQG